MTQPNTASHTNMCSRDRSSPSPLVSTIIFIPVLLNLWRIFVFSFMKYMYLLIFTFTLYYYKYYYYHYYCIIIITNIIIIIYIRFVVAFSSSGEIVNPFDFDIWFASVCPQITMPINSDFEYKALIQSLNYIDIRVNLLKYLFNRICVLL